MRILSIGLIGAAAVALSGCAYGGFGNGLGVGVGYNSGYGYSPYGSYGSYGGYGYNPYYSAYGSPYFGYGSRYNYGYGGYGGYGGWYNGYYYPGTGYYVYDRDRNRRRISDAERAYWRQRVASGLASRIRDNRGDTVTTNTGNRTHVVTQQPVRPRQVTSRETRREQARETRQERRAARRSARDND
jgi:hypothetical protein